MSVIKKIFFLFRNIHFQSLMSNGVMSVVNMVTLAILYRALSPADISVYLFLMTILGLIDTVKHGFLTISFITFYSGTEKQRANEVAGSTWSLAIFVSFIFILINIITYFVAPYVKTEGMILFLKYFSLIALSTLPTFMANLAVQGEKRFDRLLWLRMINQLLFTGAVVLLIFLKKSTLTSLIVVYVITNILASLIIMALGWTKIYTIKYSSRKTFFQLFHFGKYALGTSLSSNLFGVTDAFFINFFLGPTAIAVYNLGGKFIQLVEIPLLSFTASVMPILADYYNNDKKEDMIYLVKKMVGMLSIAIIGVAIISIIFAEPLITLIGGHKYTHSQAPNLFRLFICFGILYPADRFFALALDVIHKNKVNFYKILIMLAINLVADYVSVSYFKTIYAIALASILPISTAIIISYIYLNNYIKFNFWNIFVVGYRELIVFIQQLYHTFTKKEKPLIN